jgi:hypothetical protein
MDRENAASPVELVALQPSSWLGYFGLVVMNPHEGHLSAQSKRSKETPMREPMRHSIAPTVQNATKNRRSSQRENRRTLRQDPLRRHRSGRRRWQHPPWTAAFFRELSNLSRSARSASVSMSAMFDRAPKPKTKCTHTRNVCRCVRLGACFPSCSHHAQRRRLHAHLRCSGITVVFCTGFRHNVWPV